MMELFKDMRFRKQIIRIISQYTTVNKRDISFESRIVEDLGLASSDMMALLAEMEDRYRFRLENMEKLSGVHTVGDLAKLITNENGK